MEAIINSVKEPIIGLNNELTILFINDGIECPESKA